MDWGQEHVNIDRARRPHAGQHSFSRAGGTLTGDANG